MNLPPPTKLNVFIGNIPQSLVRKELKDYFEQLYKFERVQIPYDEETKKNHGYLFVKCKNLQVYNKLLSSVHIIEHKKLCIRPYYEKIDKKKILNFKKSESIIFLENIGPNISNQDLYNAFSAFGQLIIAVAFKGHKKKKNEFWGYIQFEQNSSIDLLPQNYVQVKDLTIVWRRYKPNITNNNPQLSIDKKKLYEAKIFNVPERRLLSASEFYMRLPFHSDAISKNHFGDSNLRYKQISKYRLSEKWIQARSRFDSRFSEG